MENMSNEQYHPSNQITHDMSSMSAKGPSNRSIDLFRIQQESIENQNIPLQVRQWNVHHILYTIALKKLKLLIIIILIINIISF